MLVSTAFKLVTLTPITVWTTGCATERTFDVPSETVVDAIGALYDPERNGAQGVHALRRYEEVSNTKHTGPSTIIEMSEHRKLWNKTIIKVTPISDENTHLRISSKVADLFHKARDERKELRLLAEIEAKLGVAPLASKK